MPIDYPLDAAVFLRKRRSLKRELEQGSHGIPVRIAILGGVATAEVRASLEVLLLHRGIAPVFYKSEYGRFFEDAVADPAALIDFRPDVVYFCISSRNLRSFPPLMAKSEDARDCAERELAIFRQAWTAVQNALPRCTVLHNNFEPWPERPLGNCEGGAVFGSAVHIQRLNVLLAEAAQSNPRLKIVDQHGLAAHIGMGQWFSAAQWFSYKLAQTPESAVYLANAVSAAIAAAYGRTKKCLVLDLDNTLWGGVIGDDGLEQIQLGTETAVAEAYTAFQRYCKQLQQRGILLAVCSKNDASAARLAFQHPDSVLRLADFSSFCANWDAKCDNIERIAHDLNIGLDSLVFVDDNPAERDLVRRQLPAVAVPEVGDDVSRFAEILDETGYFEPGALSAEDLRRSGMVSADARRVEKQRAFQDYGEYLASLEMHAEIQPFSALYLDRIAQLTNKTNQFNLTTRRYTRAELEDFSRRSDCIALYGRLSDRFGDNGLVSVVMGFVVSGVLEIDLWLMSCRVLKREMELAMLDQLVAAALEHGATALRGRYIRTPKNAMVAEHYPALGFSPISRAADGSESLWELPLTGLPYQPRNRYIKEREFSLAGSMGKAAADLP